jgi:hypothetical protein
VGFNPKKREIQSSCNNMLWVVYTCVSRHLNQQKRNQLNLTTPPRENVRNVHEFWDILMLTQNSKIGPRIVHFLLAGWSDWADSFCNESGFLIHKFRLPTTYYSKNFESPLFLGLTPLGGPLKIFCDEKQIFSVILLCIGHHIRYLLK